MLLPKPAGDENGNDKVANWSAAAAAMATRRKYYQTEESIFIIM